MHYTKILQQKVSEKKSQFPHGKLFHFEILERYNFDTKYLCEIIKATNFPSLSTIEKLCQAFDMTYHDFYKDHPKNYVPCTIKIAKAFSLAKDYYKEQNKIKDAFVSKEQHNCFLKIISMETKTVKLSDILYFCDKFNVNPKLIVGEYL